jgi:hypothetical protein
MALTLILTAHLIISNIFCTGFWAAGLYYSYSTTTSPIVTPHPDMLCLTTV